MGKKMPLRNIIGICTICISAWATSMLLEKAAIANPRLTKQPAPMTASTAVLSSEPLILTLKTSIPTARINAVWTSAETSCTSTFEVT